MGPCFRGKVRGDLLGSFSTSWSLVQLWHDVWIKVVFLPWFCWAYLQFSRHGRSTTSELGIKSLLWKYTFYCNLLQLEKRELTIGSCHFKIMQVSHKHFSKYTVFPLVKFGKLLVCWFIGAHKESFSTIWLPVSITSRYKYRRTRLKSTKKREIMIRISFW